MNLSKNKILITGGASGIGFAMAQRFVEQGNTVIICGRREDALAEAVQRIPALITRTCNLTKADDRVALHAWIDEHHSDLNVLVNNAGVQNWMSIADADFFERAHDEIAINVLAPAHLTKLFLDHGSLNTIINVTSGLAFVPLVKTPVYSATKAFFHSFTLSLREQLRSRNIEVIEAIPPALNTDLGGKGLHDHAPPVSGFIASIFEQLEAGKTELTYGFTEAISKAGQEALKPAFARINPVG